MAGPDFIAPRIAPVILPIARYNVFINETVIVNRTVLVAGHGGRFAVNPGISPAVVAAATRRPLRTYDVRPTVLAGTAPIASAVQVRPQDLGRRNFRLQAALRPTQNVVRPADQVQPAQRGADVPATTGQAPADRQPPQQQQQPQQQVQPQQQQAQPPQQGQQQGQQRPAPTQQGRTKHAPAQAQGGGEPQRAMEQSRRERRQQQQQQQGATPQREAPTAQQQRPASEGRGRLEQRQAPQAERRAPRRRNVSRPSSRSGRRPRAARRRGARRRRKDAVVADRRTWPRRRVRIPAAPKDAAAVVVLADSVVVDPAD